VADDHRLLAASLAGALFRRTGDRSLHARQAGGQLLPPGMFAAPLWFRGRRQWLAPAFRLDFGIAHPGLKIQQLELCVAEFLAAGSVLLDPLQPQLLFQRLDPQLSPDEFLL